MNKAEYPEMKNNIPPADKENKTPSPITMSCVVVIWVRWRLTKKKKPKPQLRTTMGV